MCSLDLLFGVAERSRNRYPSLLRFAESRDSRDFVEVGVFFKQDD
jgi:hypothetical protein